MVCRHSYVFVHNGTETVVNNKNQFERGSMELDISPYCASVEERGIFLSKLHIEQLGLQKIGERDTRNYGIVDVFTGVKIRIAADKCKSVMYEIPDGFVYKTPDIYTSANLVAINHYGIPERQGIVNRELFFNHGILSCCGVIYALPNDLFQISEIPNFMSKFPSCEIPVSRSSHSNQWIYVDMNSALRRMHDVRGTDGLHPSLTDDFFDVDEAVLRLLRPLPIEYYSVSPRCCQCRKKSALPGGSSRKGLLAAVGKSSSAAVLPADLFYCPLCRSRHVQSPHVYCSKTCQVSPTLH